MSNTKEILSFDDWYKEAKKLNDDGFSAKDFFEAGQQSKQDEVDDLQYKIDEALKLLSLAYPESWGYCVDEAINILTGD